MSKIKIFVAILVAFTLGYLFFGSFFSSEESLIEEKIETILSNCEKSGADGDFGIALKTNKIKNNLDSLVFFKIEGIDKFLSKYGFISRSNYVNNSFNKDDISSAFFYGYKTLESLEGKIEKISINIVEKRAKVLVDFTFKGKVNGFNIDESLNFSISFIKKDKGWFVNGVESDLSE
ncbi:MAG: hypothetical protein CR982_04480 [Candidatus Cloacimonadota bacterium]|nr:MAG: hypothetical protein CR982_04480 [Candidatus Cloacimonadota bacterium]PIE80059.1 MAG: hypothetical protein CSA15_02240 [Candidatus Delongbacteria bacterium]